MKLYFKQKVFTLKQRSNIFDRAGNVLFTAEAEIISLGRKMHIYDDMNRTTLIEKIRPKIFRIYRRTAYSRYSQGVHFAEATLLYRRARLADKW